MNTVKFITPMVGLIVAVVLVAGLMVPVIGSLGGSGGSSESITYTNEGDMLYTLCDSNTSATLIPTADDGGSISDGEHLWKGWTVIVGDGWYVGLGVSNSVNAYFSLYSPTANNYQTYSSAEINGTNVHLTNANPSQYNVDVDLTGAKAYSWYEGDHVMMSWWNSYYPYVTEDSIVFSMLIYIVNNGNNFLLSGSSENNEISTIMDYDTTTVSSSATFDIQDNVLKGFTATFNGSEVYADCVQDNDDSDSDFRIAWVIAPVSITVEGSGSGGSGLSPTLSSLLSVIPLITVVGIVIGAIGYLRMKN